MIPPLTPHFTVAPHTPIHDKGLGDFWRGILASITLCFALTALAIGALAALLHMSVSQSVLPNEVTQAPSAWAGQCNTAGRCHVSWPTA